MIKTPNAFLSYLKVVLSEDSPNHAWASNHLMYVRKALGIRANESLDVNQVIARLDAVENEQKFAEALLAQTPAETLMSYTPDILAKIRESSTIKMSAFPMDVRKKLTECVQERLTDLTDEHGLTDYWTITDNAGNYQSLIQLLKPDSRAKYTTALEAKIDEVREQLDLGAAGVKTLKSLQNRLAKDPNAQMAFEVKMYAGDYKKLLTPQARENIAAEDQVLRENLIANGCEKETVNTVVDAKTSYRRQVMMKVATGHTYDKDPIEPAKTPAKKLGNMIKNTACAIKADPVKFIKNFAVGAVKSSVIQAATATGNLPLAALAVTGATAVYAVNEYRTMQRDMLRTEIAKQKYGVNSLSELSPNQAKEFAAECETPEMKKRLRVMGKSMRLSGEMKKQLVVKTAMELGSNVLMAIPGGKALAGKVFGGDKAAGKLLAGATKGLTSSAMQGVKYYQTQIFNARNHGATEAEIDAMRSTYRKNAFKTFGTAFAGRMAGTAFNTFATEFQFGETNTTLMEKVAASRESLLDKIPFFHKVHENPGAVADIQTQEAAKVEIPAHDSTLELVDEAGTELNANSVFAMNHPAEAAQGMAQPMNPNSVFEMNHPEMAHRGWNVEQEPAMDTLDYKQADLARANELGGQMFANEVDPSAVAFTMDKAGNHILDINDQIPAGTHWDKNGWLARENGSLYRNEDGNFSRLPDAKFASVKSTLSQPTVTTTAEPIAEINPQPTVEIPEPVIEPTMKMPEPVDVAPTVNNPVAEAPVWERLDAQDLETDTVPPVPEAVENPTPFPKATENFVPHQPEAATIVEQPMTEMAVEPEPVVEYEPVAEQPITEMAAEPEPVVEYEPVAEPVSTVQPVSQGDWKAHVQNETVVANISDLEGILQDIGQSQTPENVDVVMEEMKAMLKDDPARYNQYEQAAAVYKRHLRNQDHTRTEFEKQGYTKIGENTYFKRDGLTDMTIVDIDGDGTISAGDKSTEVMGSKEFRDNVAKYGYKEASKMGSGSHSYFEGSYDRTPAEWDPTASPEKVVDEVKINQGYQQACYSVFDLEPKEVSDKLESLRGNQSLEEFYGNSNSIYATTNSNYRSLQKTLQANYSAEYKQDEVKQFLAFNNHVAKDMLQENYGKMRAEKLQRLDAQYAQNLTQETEQVASTPFPTFGAEPRL